MTVSIITVCLNSQATIRQTIESVLAQTSDDYEYIIIDGKSTDNTLQIIDEYRDRFGEKLQVVSEQDNGIYFAMNKGLALSQGKLIAFMNSDDWYEPDAVEIAIKEYSGEKYEVIYGIERLISNEEELSCTMWGHKFLSQTSLRHQAVFVTRDCFFDFGGPFDTAYQSAADYDFFIRLSQNPQVCFHPVYKLISNFRVGGSSSTFLSFKEVHRIKYKYGYLTKYSFYKKMLIQYIRFFLGKTK